MTSAVSSKTIDLIWVASIKSSVTVYAYVIYLISTVQ